MVRMLCIFLMVALCVSFTHTQAEKATDTADFTLVKRNEGISLYERWYEREPDVATREVKATFMLEADIETAIDLIRNESQGRTWNKNTRVYRVLDQSPDAWVCYVQYNLPWPLNDQDCVLAYRTHRQGSTVYIPFASTEHAAFPEENRVTRIPDVEGRWVFTPAAGGTRVEYYITTEPSGSLPVWITDPVIRSNLLATLQAFRDILQARALTRNK